MKEPQTLDGHLAELRRRVIVSIAVLFGAMAVAFFYAGQILSVLRAPAAGMIDRLVYFSPIEAVVVYFKAAFFSALIFTAPVILYQLWAFVSPAMDARARKFGPAFLALTALVFISGVLAGYFVLLPAAVKFLIGFSDGVLEPLISASEYVSFVLCLLLACGLVVEMPVLAGLLARLGILDHRFLQKHWRVSVVIIFIIAAIVTPTPDAFSMLVVTIPMLALYGVSIGTAWICRREANEKSRG